MRKRLLRPKGQGSTVPNLKPASIITFDHPQENIHLFDHEPKKNIPLKQLEQHLEVLRLSAARANTVCLAANQAALPIRAITMYEQPLSESSRVEWVNQQGYTQPQKYTLFNNPVILTGKNSITIEEESISFPFMLFTTNRYNRITLTHDRQRQKKNCSLEGVKAWVFQQAYQQLQGVTLLDWRVNHGRLAFKLEMVKYFPKSSAIIQEYAKDLKSLFAEYPQLIEQPVQVQEWSQIQSTIQKEVLSFEGDYIRRVIKHYQKQMSRLWEMIESGSINMPLPKKGDNSLKITFLK